MKRSWSESVTRITKSSYWNASSLVFCGVAAPICIVLAVFDNMSKTLPPRITVHEVGKFGLKGCPAVVLSNDGSSTLRIFKLAYDGHRDICTYLLSKGVTEDTLAKFAFTTQSAPFILPAAGSMTVMLPRPGATLTVEEEREVLKVLKKGFYVQIQYALPLGLWRNFEDYPHDFVE